MYMGPLHCTFGALCSRGLGPGFYIVSEGWARTSTRAKREERGALTRMAPVTQ